MDTIRSALTPEALVAFKSAVLGTEQERLRFEREKAEDQAGNRKARRRARAADRRARRRVRRQLEPV